MKKLINTYEKPYLVLLYFWPPALSGAGRPWRYSYMRYIEKFVWFFEILRIGSAAALFSYFHSYVKKLLKIR